jgi:hypothetical protein
MRYEVTAPDGRRFEVEAPNGMSPEVLAREVEAALGIQQPQAAAQTGRGGGALPFLNQGIIAGVLGAPVDLVNTLLGATGLPVSERPLGGSASIEAGMAGLGRMAGVAMVPERGQLPETFEEYVGRGVGEAAGMLIPGYGAARLATRSANPLVAGIGRRVAAAPVTAPVGTTAMELASGAGAGAGRMIGETSFPDVAGAGTLGELAGGLGVGSLAAMPGVMAQSPTGRAIARTVTPFTEAGGRARASGRLTGLVADPEAAATAAEAPSIGNLTPAQRTGDVRLLALERAVAEADPTIAERLRQRAVASEGALVAEAQSLGGEAAQTRAFLESRRARLETALDERMRQARTTAQQRIAALEPNAPAEAASRIVREEFDAAYQAGMLQERELWQAIPQDVQIDTAPLFRRFDEIVNATPRTQQHNIPGYAREFLSPKRNSRLADMEHPAMLQGFRSALLEIARRARADNARTMAGIAEKLAEATLNVMNSLPATAVPYGVARDIARVSPDLAEAALSVMNRPPSEIAGPYDLARNFTRTLNARFRDGEVGVLTRTTPEGAPRVAPEMTLPVTIGRGGVAGGVAARELSEATDQSPRAMGAVEDFLRRSFRDSAVNAEGQMRPDAALNWLRRNEQLVEQFPAIRQAATDAMAAQQAADAASIRQETVTRNLRAPRTSALARYLEADYGEEIARVFAAQNPAGVAASLRRAVARDPSGQALAGLRGAMVDHLIDRARAVTTEGTVVRGSVIMGALNDPQQAAALRVVFDADQMRRLRQIGTELTALERARGALPSVGAPMEDMPNRVIEIVGRIVAARVGAATGGNGMAGSLQSAQIMSSRMRDFLRRITNDRAGVLLSEAVTDPALFAALMAPGRTLRQQELAARRLQAWIAGPTGRAVFGEDDEAER